MIGNSITNNYKKYYNSFYTLLDETKIQYIRKNYTVIDVDWLDKTLVNSKMFNNEFFEKYPQKKEIINNMLDFYLNDKDKNIYIKTEYLCNEKEKICICNINADDFRKIINGTNYQPNLKYISWCKKDNDHF